MKLIILIVAFIALWSSAQADKCVALLDVCGIATTNSTCGSLGDDCAWTGSKCELANACGDIETQDKCDKDDACAWDVAGQCDAEANIIGCLISAEYIDCIFAESVFDYGKDFEELAAERVCACAVGQIACLAADDCEGFYQDLLAVDGYPEDAPDSLCESVIVGFSEELDLEDDTCGGLCDQDFGYSSGNSTWGLSLKFDKVLKEEDVEKAVAGSIVGVEVSDVTATEVKSGGNSADVTLMAKDSEFDIEVTIPAGRPITAERIDKIGEDLSGIADNKFMEDATGAKTTVTTPVTQTEAAGISKDPNGAANIAISMVSMIFVVILAIIA
jgi:hypothetical protein